MMNCFLKGLGIYVAVLAVLYLLAPHNLFFGVSLFIFFFGAGFYLIFFYPSRCLKNRNIRLVAIQKEKLIATGFNIDHYMDSMPPVAFDNGTKKFAFIFIDMSCIFDYSDALSWQHTWIDHTNKYGVLSRIQNGITFNLRSMDKPVVKVGIASAEQWFQRLNLIFNEQIA